MIVYQPFDFTYDKQRMREEIDRVPKELFTKTIFPWKEKVFNPQAFGNWTVGTKEMNENVSRWYRENNERVNVQGPIETPYTLSASWVPEEPVSRDSVYRVSETGKIDKLHTLYQHPWQWRDDIHIPYIREVVAQLPFEFVQLTRLIVTAAGGFCPVHQDESRQDPYYDLGFGKINFNIMSGNQPLIIKAGDHTYYGDADTFYVNSAFPHGVEPITEKRVQIQVCGKLRKDWQSFQGRA